MKTGFDNLRLFFEKIKSLTLWQRLFDWRSVRVLSYDAYDDFAGLADRITTLEQELNEGESAIREAEKNREISANRISDLENNNRKLENRLEQLEKELSRLKEEKSELTSVVARFEQAEKTKTEEFNKNIAAVNAVREGLEAERRKISDDRVREIQEQQERIKMTWRSHEENVKTAIKNICRIHAIDYIEKVPFRGNPDNAVMIGGEYIVFDAKSPAGDDLDNFPKYLKKQADELKKYAKLENVKSDIFLVIPSNTVDVVKQYSLNMGDYNVYIITVNSIEPVMLSLKKIETYEFAEQLSPEERENICRIIGKFTHTAKRRIQIDYFFSYQFLDILSKCNMDLPADIAKSVEEFERAEKLNPPQEKRAKQILLDDLLEQTGKLSIEMQARLREEEERSGKPGSSE